MSFSPLYQHIQGIAQQHPDRIAVTFRDEQISFSRLIEIVDHIADSLLTIGLNAGDCVALLCTPRPEALFIHLATSKIGVVLSGLNPKYQPREIDYVLEHAAPQLLISIDQFDHTDYATLLRSTQSFGTYEKSIFYIDGAAHSVANGTHFLQNLREQQVQPLASTGTYATYGADASLLVYTSGTTGKPKGALIRSADILYRAQNQAQYFPTQQPPAAINFSPINHVGGIVFRGMSQLVAGGKIIYQEKYVPSEIAGLIAEHGVNILLLGPTAYQMLADTPDFTPSIFEGIEWFIFAGAPMPEATLAGIQETIPHIGCAYGMTESVATVSMASTRTHSLASVASSIGVPVDAHEFSIRSEDGSEITAPHTVGELYIRAEHCMIGYHRNAQATQDTVTADGWVKTGDLACRQEDGCYRLIGRLKEMYKSGGYNIYPREIENVLESHPSVALACVVAIDDPKYQQVGHAYVQAKDKNFQDSAALLAWCKQHLANYKVPKKIVICDALPLLHNGKVDKKTLQQRSTQID